MGYLKYGGGKIGSENREKGDLPPPASSSPLSVSRGVPRLKSGYQAVLTVLSLCGAVMFQNEILPIPLRFCFHQI